MNIGDDDLTLSKNDRKRLNRVASEMGDRFHPGWSTLDSTEQAAGQRNLTLLALAAKLDG